MMNNRILVIDNYDSFTYNLVHLIEELTGHEPSVKRNDEIGLAAVDTYDTLVLSPGPGIPDEAGLLKPIIQTYTDTKRILGVCLGMQAIGEVFGADLKNLDRVFHGIQSTIYRTRVLSALFDGVPDTFKGGRYHSWVIEATTLPDLFDVLCHDDDGEVMGIAHKSRPLYGLQFHPESIMTPLGRTILSNFLFNTP